MHITNLSAATASRMMKEFTRVQISAGYEGLYGVIFDGTIVQAQRGRDSSTDTFCNIVAVNGDQAYNQAIIAKTLAAGANQADVHSELLDSMSAYGITKGTTSDALTSSPALPRGRVLFGMSRNVMRDVARSTGTTWTLQDGKLHVIDELGYLPNQAIVITKETGMVGMPTLDPNGVLVRCLLNPLLKPFQRIKLDNNSIQVPPVGVQYAGGAGVGADGKPIDYGTDSAGNKLPSQDRVTGGQIDGDGIYVINAIDHYGDTRGNDWYSQLTAVAASQGATIASAQQGRGGIPDPAPAPLPAAASPAPASGALPLEALPAPLPSVDTPPRPLSVSTGAGI